MDEMKCHLYDKIGYVKERVEILHSTLLDVYMDWKEGIHDLGVSMEAVHGSVEQAREAGKELQEILELLKKAS